MDTQTRHALKQDKFASATLTGLDWLQGNRTLAITTIVAAIIILAIIITSAVVYNSRSATAKNLFGQAMDIYNTPIAEPGVPAEPGFPTYPSTAARAKAANPIFVKVADRYNWQKTGKNAEYFAGLTYLEMGRTASAQAELQKAAHSGDSGLEALAKMALAGLYRQTGRPDEAADLYQKLIKRPTATVPASAAQLALASMYEISNPAEAKKIYAQIKDQDKGTVAAQIASQRLTGK